jgi:Cdc6-like AAA superfamily ATPase
MAIDTMQVERLSQAFTPHRPIDLPKFLSGRVELLYRAMDAANTEGLHVILFGDRGTGKTSLARVLGLMLQEPTRSDGRRVLVTSCNSSDDFTSIWRRVFQEVLVAPRQLGFSPDRSQIAVHRMQDFDATDPNDVRLMVQSLPNPSVIVIDEFDRVPASGDARRLMADTIKLFSDTGVKATIILVGVADSIGQLIAEHQSISRNIEQIPVEPMSPTELGDIIRKGYDHVGIGYQDSLPRHIAELSQGYPHYTHLLGLWAGRRALESGAADVTPEILDEAIPAALKGATGGVQHEYEKAILSSQKDALFEEVLLACALTKKDSLGRFATADVRVPLRLILDREIAIGGYQSHLAKFCESERGPVLRKSGKPRSYRWQFVNPQIIPYILIRGKERGVTL